MKENNYDKKDYINLILQKIEGFRFKSDPAGPLSWYPSREKFVGKEGTIVDVHAVYPYIKIDFHYTENKVDKRSQEWYPIANCEEHLIKEKTDEDLFLDIHKLLIKI